MTDEEIKVIEYWKEELKSYKKEIEQRQNDEFKGYGTLEDIAKLKYSNLHIMLNLIEKQQAEIEKYKEMYATSIATKVNEAFKQEHKNNEDLEMLYKGCQIELEEKDKYISKLENKLMYALSPTTHELALTTQEQFKTIIRNNLEEDTYTIRRTLKEYWEDK